MTKPNQSRRVFLARASAAALVCAVDQAHAQDPVTVLFVCEHGYGKSLVAARHFERLAQERGLSVRTISRGVDPGAAVPPPIAAGLAADGFTVAGFTPTRIAASELASADYVVLIAVDVDARARSGPTLRWDDVSALSENYARARDELVAHDTALLDRIASAGR